MRLTFRTRAGTLAVVVSVVVLPLVEGAAPGVHEEVGHGAHLEAELLRYRGLHLLRRPLRLLEYGVQRAPLDVREHEAGLLGGARLLVLLVRLRLFSFTN